MDRGLKFVKQDMEMNAKKENQTSGDRIIQIFSNLSMILVLVVVRSSLQFKLGIVARISHQLIVARISHQYRQKNVTPPNGFRILVRSEPRYVAVGLFALFTNFSERGSHCIVTSLSANNNF